MLFKTTRMSVYALIFALAPGEQHAYGNVSGAVLINILFDPDQLGLAESDLSDTPGFHALFSLEPRWRGVAGYLQDHGRLGQVIKKHCKGV